MKLKDLHSHCLPCVDDGAKTLKDSLDMLSESFRQNVGLCAATPHCIIHKQKDLEEFLTNRENSLKILNEEIEKQGGEYPKLILGGEVYLDNDINRYDGLERVCYTGTNYLLLEFPMTKANPIWAEWIYEMNRKGIKILVAHVDRYPEWEKMMSDFKGLDVKYQVNASRFLHFSDRGLLKKIFEHNHRYIISSDMHNTTSRKCNMQSAYEKAKKKFPDVADELFGLNAEKILGL